MSSTRSSNSATDWADEKNWYTFPIHWKDKHPFLRSNYDSQTEDKLCHICRQIDFDYFIRHNSTWPRTLILGSTDALRARAKDCVLCTIAVSAWPSRSVTPKAEDHYNIALVCTEDEGDDTVAIVHFMSPSESATLIDFRHGASPKVRKVQRRYEPKLLRDWLRDCDHAANHARSKKVAEKTVSATATGRASAKRFIDVQRECVVDASSLLEPTKYVALSYVWGREPQKVLLTNASAPQLYRPGFLSTVKNLPKTIRDAITVCQDLDISLLWVDALCIRQDGVPELDQLGIMHLIYEGAAFSIVALAGDSADHGLVGVSGDDQADRQVKVRVHGQELLMSETLLSSAINSAYWSSRAWTYQEFILSPRRIVFHENIIYYSCCHGSFKEDSHYRKHKNSDNGMEYHAIDWTSVGWGTYRSTVVEYTQKKLSYDTDFLLAFSAVLEALKREGFTKKFTFALPVSHFDEALLWRRSERRDITKEEYHINGSRPRRESVILLPDEFQEGGPTKPPSWSWASFQGKVKYCWKQYTPRNHIRRVKFVTEGTSKKLASMGQVLELDADVATFKLALPRPEDSDDEDSDEEDDDEEDDDEEDDDEEDDDEEDSDEDDDEEDSDEEDEEGSDEEDLDEEDDDHEEETGYGRFHLKIIDSKPGSENCHCGIVVEDNIAGDPPTEASFIKLSQCSLDRVLSGLSDTEKVKGPGKNRLGHLPRVLDGIGNGYPADHKYSEENQAIKDSPFFDHKVFDSKSYEWKKWPVYNVLMVAWREDGVAVRLGIGKIHVDAFDRAESFECKRFKLA